MELHSWSYFLLFQAPVNVKERLGRERKDQEFHEAKAPEIEDHAIPRDNKEVFEEEEGILQLEYISFILHLLGSHLQSGPEVGGN